MMCGTTIRASFIARLLPGSHWSRCSRVEREWGRRLPERVLAVAGFCKRCCLRKVVLLPCPVGAGAPLPKTGGSSSAYCFSGFTLHLRTPLSLPKCPRQKRLAMKTNILQKFELFNDHWSPKIIGELNGQQLKLAKVKGEFVWHDHANEDELFLIYKGTLFLDFRDRETVELNPGDFYIVPKGVQHFPRTKDGMEVWLLLLEPASTKHTGEVKADLTVEECEWI